MLEAPETYAYIMLAPTECVELWVDFSGRKPGTDLILRSLEYDMFHMGGMGMGRHGGGMMGGELAQGAAFPIVTFHIAGKVRESPKLPQSLVKIRKLTDRDVSIRIGLSRLPPAWTICPLN